MFDMIGYGNIYPTTVGGKVFTCGYALFGIPLTLSAFNNIGELMCRPFNFLWNLFHRRRKGKTADSGETEFRRESLPVSLGLLITLCWIIISATYFFFMSANSDTTWYPTSNWYFGDAIYFVFISITTIGQFLVRLSSITNHSLRAIKFIELTANVQHAFTSP